MSNKSLLNVACESSMPAAIPTRACLTIHELIQIISEAITTIAR